MNIDYWRQFIKSGSVQDYLNYRNSISQENEIKDNEQSDNKGNRDSNKGSKNQRE